MSKFRFKTGRECVIAFLSQPCDVALLLLCGSIWACRTTIGYWGWLDLLAIAAASAAWCPAEYMVHRWLFHELPGLERTIHLEHHLDPYNPRSGCIRPHSLVYLGVLPATALLLLNPRPIGWTIYATLLSWYVAYEFVHFVLHTGWSPRVLRNRRQSHWVHHLVDDRTRYGLLFRWWDTVRRT